MNPTRLTFFVLLTVLISFFTIIPAMAQAEEGSCPEVSDLKKEIESLKEKQDQTYTLLVEVQEQLRKIKMRSSN